MTAFVIAIEGGDGVGKNTISNALAEGLRLKGRAVAVIDFPRYHDTLAGEALTKFLNGKSKKPLTASVAAGLYALDRLEYKDEIDAAISSNDFVIFDRYVASNMAYQAAKVSRSQRLEMMQWVADLELTTFRLPKPNLNILLRLDVASARNLVRQKPKRQYTRLVHDIHEADDSLQVRLRDNYDYLASQGAISEWLTVEVSERDVLRKPQEICCEIVSYLSSAGIDVA